jgi:hypothetical protein
MPRQHDHDAGGAPDVLAAKATLRNEVWAAMKEAKAARFPGAVGRIPNFTGAEAAAERLRGTTAWTRAASPWRARPGSSATAGWVESIAHTRRLQCTTRCTMSERRHPTGRDANRVAAGRPSRR